jgi:hypothetical protein
MFCSFVPFSLLRCLSFDSDSSFVPFSPLGCLSFDSDNSFVPFSPLRCLSFDSDNSVGIVNLFLIILVVTRFHKFRNISKKSLKKPKG